jgi:predicted dehydrogenase
MARKLGFGVVGVGIMGQMRLRTLKNLENVHVVGIADINPQRAEEVAKKFGINKWFANYEDLLKEPELEAVVVATPDFAHRDIVISAAEAGKHIHCEKPLATTLSDADKMIYAARRHNVKLMVNFTARFNPICAAIKRVVESGEIGKPVQGFDRIDDTIYVPTQMLSWAGKTSPAFFLTVHSADRQRWILGSEAEEVYATSRKLVLKEKNIDTEDFLQAIIRFRNGASVIVETSWILPNTYPTISENLIKVVGTKGAVYWLTNQPYVICYTEKGSISGAEMIFRVLGGQPPEEGMKHFVECIIQDKTPVVTGEDGRAATEIALAILQSAYEKRVVKLPLTNYKEKE